ncbi:MAG: TIGR02594 family protein [Pseudomonadota bacterium]
MQRQLTKNEWKDVQRQLRRRGFDPVYIDGIPGKLTDKAIVAFKRSIGYRARPYLGPLTWAALFEDKVDPYAKAPADVKDVVGGNKRPPWLRLAYANLGLREIRGSRHNRKIVGWWEQLKLHFRDDETPWCAGFLNAIVQQAGFAIPRKYRAAALGWRWTAHGTRLDGPALGAIMDMTRPGRPGSGHITFVAGRDDKGRVMGLGGNQGNMVQINPYHPTARDARYYWPPGYPLPTKTGVDTMPLITRGGKVLTNEA